MEFRGLETTVVDLLATEELQRLRRIRQLGLGHLVFPSAEHSRLAHSIGAAHLAIRFMRRLEDATEETLDRALRPDQEARRDVAVAAVVHDIGHGPLSHAWEAFVEGYDHAAWCAKLDVPHLASRIDLNWHELVGQALLAWPEGELHRALEVQQAGFSVRVRELLDGQHYLSYVPRLLAADIDVDRGDYMARDALMTGVAYGRYDIDWLISTATVGVRAGEERRHLVVGFDSRKAVRVIEQFVVARRALYDTVYRHKTVGRTPFIGPPGVRVGGLGWVAGWCRVLPRCLAE
jgi:hypothetical protein